MTLFGLKGWWLDSFGRKEGKDVITGSNSQIELSNGYL